MKEYLIQSAALFRGTVVASDDKPKMQGMTVKGRFGHTFTAVEYFEQHGFSAVPLPPASPDAKETAEVLMAYLNGDPAHPVAVVIADRRHRPRNRKPGDVSMYDHRKQHTRMHEGGVTHETPLTIEHQITDEDGNVLSTVTQHKGGARITLKTMGGAVVEMDGANITKRAGPGGKVHIDGPVTVKGSLVASESIEGGSVLSGGLPVQTV